MGREYPKTIQPSGEEYLSLAKEKNLIPVTMEINLDLDTPVAVYLKLVGDKKGFILESADTTHQTFGRYSIIGAEPFIHLQVFKHRLMVKEHALMRCLEGSPLDTIRQYMSKYHTLESEEGLPLANGGLVGYFNYEVAATFDRIRGLELGEEELLGEFMLCRVLVVHDALKSTGKLIYLCEARDGMPMLSYEEVTSRLKMIREKLTAPLPVQEMQSAKSGNPVDFMEQYGQMPEDFLKVVTKAKEYIRAGEIFQVVPSCQFRTRTTKPPFAFYRKLRKVNPSPYMFYLNFDGRKLVGASPEMLVKVSRGQVYTYPIAGTRKRGAGEAEDEAMRKELLADAKECAEHSMLVDLARNDIGRIAEAKSVRVPKLREVEYFSHVMHMVSSVTGKLRKGMTPMEVLQAVFPAGTVSGAPKLRAMEIIHELEHVRRETYSGTVGYMDFNGNMDMCITLRTMRLEEDGTAVIQSGAGLVADSVPENEYREILQKSRALFEVVEEVERDDPDLG